MARAGLETNSSGDLSLGLFVVLGIEYCYLLMRTWRPTVELNMYEKTEKHTYSLFFNRIAVKKNFQKV